MADVLASTGAGEAVKPLGRDIEVLANKALILAAQHGFAVLGEAHPAVIPAPFALVPRKVRKTKHHAKELEALCTRHPQVSAAAFKEMVELGTLFNLLADRASRDFQWLQECLTGYAESS